MPTSFLGPTIFLVNRITLVKRTVEALIQIYNIRGLVDISQESQI